MSDQVHITLLFFAKARELIGRSSSPCTVPASCTYSQLVECIRTNFPHLKTLGDAFVLSLNEDYIEEEGQINISEGDELAVIPPISGG
jgi:molybdopterin synthase catalytic subunit